MKALIEIVGWYGTAAIVGAYALVSFSVLAPSSIWYQLLTATGAIGIVVASFAKRAYQPVVVNVIWTVIAILAIISILQ